MKFKTNKKTGSVQTKKLVLFKQKNWFRSNKMSVNVSKTKYIVFRPRGITITVILTLMRREFYTTVRK